MSHRDAQLGAQFVSLEICSKRALLVYVPGFHSWVFSDARPEPLSV